MQRWKTILIPLLVVTGVFTLVSRAARSPLTITSIQTPARIEIDDDLTHTVAAVDQYFSSRWTEAGIEPAARLTSRESTDGDLRLMRRLSLCLHGTIPSLEEVRDFEQDADPDRIDRWTARMLADNRFGDYFADRLSKNLVGADEGPFVIFRRDKFAEWLSDRLQNDVPWNTTVHEIIASEGLWTGNPPTNFITSAIANDELDYNKLTGRSVRMFLGQRIDCAQCHDDFVNGIWKRHQFEGLTAFYGQTRSSIFGIEDKLTDKGKPIEYTITDPGEEEPRVIQPEVPFGSEWLSADGSRRLRLAGWITHAENRRFERAIVNRVWGLMFGRPWSAGAPYFAPVDDLPAPGENEERDLLDIVGADFRANNFSIKRLIRTIAATQVYQLDSTHPTDDAVQFDEIRHEWAVFPLVRLRPEQVIGSMLQAAYIRTIDQNSHLTVRFIRFTKENDFIKDYGDLGDNELDERASTIPQALLRMNGEFTSDLIKTSPFTASGRILALSGSDEALIDNAYLVCLTRRPMDSEQQHFLQQFQQQPTHQRDEITQDLFWSLFNSPEFSWNH